MIKREAQKTLQHLAAQYPVIMLTGPRQSGKTTLSQEVFPKKPYVLLEDFDTREYALSDPREFLAQYPKGAILDEVQKAPNLISYIQGIVDKKKQNGMFILTGSQNLLLSHKITQSLAGRTAILKLLPFSFKEINKFTSSISIDEILLNGFLPRIYDQKLNPYEALSFYFQTYVERDVRELLNLKDMLRFQAFVKLCAGRVGQLLNLSSLGNEVGISHQTARDWLSILEVSYIVFLLPPYHRNFNKRITKSPKLYFYDVGLATHLLGIENTTHVNRHPLKGNIFENMIIAELMKYRYNRALENNLFFFRDSNGNEVDIIIECPNGLKAVEIKSGQTIASDFFKGLDYFQEIAKDCILKKFLIYGGEDEQKRTKAHVLPFHKASIAMNN